MTSPVNFAWASMICATHSTSVCAATWRWMPTNDSAAFSVRVRYSPAAFLDVSRALGDLLRLGGRVLDGVGLGLGGGGHLLGSPEVRVGVC